MNKLLLILLGLFASFIQAAEPRELFKEFLIRDKPIVREMIILVCETIKNGVMVILRLLFTALNHKTNLSAYL